MKITCAFFALFFWVSATHAATMDFNVTLLDGKSWRLQDQRGKWVIANFWATWCVPCIEEMPQLDALAKARKKDVSVIGLAFDDSEKAEIVAFSKERPVSYPLAQVDVFAPPKVFEIPKGLPTTYIIDPNGNEAGKLLGPITRKLLEKTIADAKKKFVKK
jgi:thiol-disulfide isomerase/thioredoxin